MKILPSNRLSTAAGSAEGAVGVIDVGSNSVRMVVFQGPRRGRLPVFNEKVLCGLGRSLDQTGRLDPEGVERAIATLRRFRGLLTRMGLEDVHTAATAAVRDAADGAAFVERVREELNLKLRVISGSEEAKLAGFGVLYGEPMADGLVGDLGGGSLELVHLKDGVIQEATTLPLGSLRLNPKAARKQLRSKIMGQLEKVPWLKEIEGRSLYVVGGAWRSVARVHMAKHRYPLKIIHHYEVKPDDIRGLSRLLSNQSKPSLERTPGVSSRRLDTLPNASLTLRCLMDLAKPKNVIFSANGLREGLLYDVLSTAERNDDPLLAACHDMARVENRFAVIGEELFEWMTPLFADETPRASRLRMAACLLSDIGWRVHPDYRDRQAFRRILRAPFAGVDHPSRAEVALAVYVRYRGSTEGGAAEVALKLLTPEQVDRAMVIGYALRLAHTLGGGLASIVGHSRLSVSSKRLVLQLGAEIADLDGEAIARRVETLARLMNIDGVIETPVLEPES